MNLKWTLLIHSFSRPKMNLKWTWNEPQLSFAPFTCEEEQRRVKVMQLVYPSRLRLRSISTASMLIHGHYRHRKRTYQELLLAKQRCFDPKRTPSGIICRACCIDEGWNDENLYKSKLTKCTWVKKLLLNAISTSNLQANPSFLIRQNFIDGDISQIFYSMELGRQRF